MAVAALPVKDRRPVQDQDQHGGQGHRRQKQQQENSGDQPVRQLLHPRVAGALGKGQFPVQHPLVIHFAQQHLPEESLGKRLRRVDTQPRQMGLGQLFPETGRKKARRTGHDHPLQLVGRGIQQLRFPRQEMGGSLPCHRSGSRSHHIVQPVFRALLPGLFQKLPPKGSKTVRIAEDRKVTTTTSQVHPLIDRPAHGQGNQGQADDSRNDHASGGLGGLKVRSEHINDAEQEWEHHRKGSEMHGGVFQGEFVGPVAVTAGRKQGRHAEQQGDQKSLQRPEVGDSAPAIDVESGKDHAQAKEVGTEKSQKIIYPGKKSRTHRPAG